MDSFHFIVNPVAGKGNGNHALQHIEKYLSDKNVNYKISKTEYHGHARELALNHSLEYNHVIAVGGDGTINEVINGLDLNLEKILGIIPIGSGNDFALNLNLSKNITENLDLIIAPNKNLKSFKIGLIRFSEDEKKHEFLERRFINSLGIGFDAFVAHLNQSNKVLRGIVSYIVAVFKALIHYTALDISCQVDNQLINGKKLLVTIGSGKSSGGGFYLTPNAEISSNEFEICFIDFVKRFKLIRSLPLAIINKIDLVKEVTLKKCLVAEIELKNPYFIHTDGEIISTKLKYAHISGLDNNLRVIARA